VISVPWLRRLRGATLRFQMIGSDPKANALGLVFSNRIDLTLPLYEPGGFSVSNTFARGYDFTRS